MQIRDYVELGSTIVLLLTLLILIWQVYIQNKIFKAQFLKERYDMSQQAYEPISEEVVKKFHVFHIAFVGGEKYEKYYKNDNNAIHKFMAYLKEYEYFIFSYALNALGLPDPLHFEKDMNQRMASWIQENMKYGEREFLDVCEYYKDDYPQLATFIHDIIKQAQ